MKTLAYLLLFCLSCPVVLAAPMGEADARHLLGRAGLGARTTEIAGFAALSRQEAVAQLLAPVRVDARTPLPADVAAHVPPSQLRDADGAARKQLEQEARQRGIALRLWWLDEMLATSTPAEQLRERMTLFWHNHFVSSLQKVKSTGWMVAQNQLLRRHALERFGPMLHAVSRDPAMIVYLDGASNRKGSPNENFAREVMELFTLGEGNYTEQDIKEAARAFTGWSIDRETGEFRWRAFAHDDGVKTVLGQSGNFDGDAVLDILLARPETANFVVSKLWREFVSPDTDNQKSALAIRRVAERFRSSGYDIRVALKAVFESDAFWAPSNRDALVKSPVDLLVGVIRAESIRLPDGRLLAVGLRTLGQDLFAPPNVRGWPGGENWINSSTLLARKSALERLLNVDALRRLPAPERDALRERWLAAQFQLK